MCLMAGEAASAQMAPRVVLIAGNVAPALQPSLRGPSLRGPSLRGIATVSLLNAEQRLRVDLGIHL